MGHRTFLAIDIDEQVRLRLARLSSELATCGSGEAKLRWVRPANLHLTVKFLGEIEEDALAVVCERAETLAAETPPFDIHLYGAHDLPQRMTDRMVLAEVQPADTLASLAERLDVALAGEGFAPEGRAFRPHVTLARTKSRRGRVPRGLTDALGGQVLGCCRVEHLTVYTSELTRQGAIYAPAARCAFQGV